MNVPDGYRLQQPKTLLMILFKESAAIHNHLHQLKLRGRRIGFVPTMGALHKGHLSLIELSREQCDITVCSIFINPTQFNDPKDFDKYPVTLEQDILLLEQHGCDILFLPSVAEMYPEGFAQSVHYDFGLAETVLEGKFRPGHFQGVGQIVEKLLHITTPAVLFLGQKDYQQCMIIRRLIQLMNAAVELVIGLTYREPDGLAMSSRNLRLSAEHRHQATAIFEMLQYIREHFRKIPARGLEQYAADYLLSHGFEHVDYVSIADAERLQPVQDPPGPDPAVVLIAAFIGGVRLIDNMVIA